MVYFPRILSRCSLLTCVLLVGCQSLDNYVSTRSDAEICQRVFNPDGMFIVERTRTKEWIKENYSFWDAEMAARHLNCAIRFPSAGYDGKTWLERMMSSEHKNS
jgi:hypothetical protein